MENPKLDPNIVIDALGGTGAVADLCEVTDAAVSQWRSRGFIPPTQLRYLRLKRPKVFRKLENYAVPSEQEEVQP